ncbi:hypothetical protein [Dictyobacter arantiisoli]|uniref:Uncharacterized protein n=1 Tax=Dictyobacter arantiisoli TaxID=2014874 RepID=A0A5A5TGL0_9CHLR|nr:hypothetical protein [Dictyobacter arantiisoli]GCF10497.1 hypothetical protein KDI_40610 [Dictyobacter arantiisoli]
MSKTKNELFYEPPGIQISGVSTGEAQQDSVQAQLPAALEQIEKIPV